MRHSIVVPHGEGLACWKHPAYLVDEMFETRTDVSRHDISLRSYYRAVHEDIVGREGEGEEK